MADTQRNATKAARTPSHDMIAHSHSSVEYVKCQVSWRNSAFLSFLWVSVPCRSLHLPIQATLLLLKWPTKPQRDLLENSYVVTLAPGKSQEIWVFIDSWAQEWGGTAPRAMAETHRGGRKAWIKERATKQGFTDLQETRSIVHQHISRVCLGQRRPQGTLCESSKGLFLYLCIP